MSRAGFGLFRRVKSLRRVFSHLIGDQRGNVAAIAALLMLPVLGGFALATEASGWYLINRAAQNAADSAALAAASNNDFATGGTSYSKEGMAVAANYGFTDGSNAATVLVTHITTDSVPACASGNGGCYEAVVTKSVSLYFSQIVGYSGNTAFGAGRGQLIQAGALAIPKTALVNDCITSLGTGKDTILFDGSPDGNLTGCVLKSNGDVACNGHDDNFRIIVYGGKNKNGNCQPAEAGGAFLDPYQSCGPNKNLPCYPVPANSCGANYPGQTINSLVGSTVTVCGNATLGANIQASGNQVLVVENGALNLNGHTLSTPSGTGLTIIFSGTNSVANFITGSGTIDIAAPTTGGFAGYQGVAIAQLYQSPPPNVGLTLDGNTPTLKITGLVYLPETDLIIKGAIDHATNGANCFTLVDDTVNIKGTGSIFQYPASQCLQAGLQAPQSLLVVGAQLVY